TLRAQPVEGHMVGLVWCDCVADDRDRGDTTSARSPRAPPSRGGTHHATCGWHGDTVKRHERPETIRSMRQWPRSEPLPGTGAAVPHPRRLDVTRVATS